MGDEIERRFLVDVEPDDLRPESSDRLDQGYLAIDGPVEVRVRQDATGWVLCIKSGSGLVRTEVERQLDPEEGEQLWQMTVGRRIGKQRQRIALDSGDVAELDTFDDDLGGLQLVEVEFASKAEAERFDPPDWFGLEVTHDSNWGNVSLATAGLPPSPPKRR